LRTLLGYEWVDWPTSDDNGAMSEHAADAHTDGGVEKDRRSATRAAADAWAAQMDALGGFIRAQRQLAKLSLREMASMTSVSNAYLSQIERGLHQPSLKVLRSIAEALDLSTEQMLSQAGWMRSAGTNGSDADHGALNGGPPQHPLSTEECIRRDPRLSPAQRDALVSVYRSFVGDSG
jgi:transcriptional regulator with XRE-family HTH domain